MSKNSELYLIKDFINQNIVLYWADSDDKRVSPLLQSLQLAEEWWIKHKFSNHNGGDRRSSFIDRRKLYNKREANAHTARMSSKTSEGRRNTDRNIKVDIDLSRNKLLQFYTTNPELLKVE